MSELTNQILADQIHAKYVELGHLVHLAVKRGLEVEVIPRKAISPALARYPFHLQNAFTDGDVLEISQKVKL